MHPSALEFGSQFFNTYCKDRSGIVVVDIGSQNINGSLRDVCPHGMNYKGVDFCPGKGVDIVLEDPYKLPFDDGSIDVVVCSSVFEHSQFFWVLFLEVMRTLKPEGLFYLNVPSNGYVHRYPVDCWRFYPDSALALVAWAERNGYSPALLESFVGEKNYLSIESDAWNDFVAVFIKDTQCRGGYKERIIQSLDKYANAYCDDGVTEVKANLFTDDFLLISAKILEIAGLNQNLANVHQKNNVMEQTIAARAERIAELEKVVMELRQTLDAQQRHADVLKGSLDEVYSSMSWRATALLRNIKARFLR